MADCPHDFHFTLSGFLNFFNEIEKKNINTKKIYLFADGSLKTKENIIIFLQLAKTKKKKKK